MDWQEKFTALYAAVAACEAPEGTQVDDVLAEFQDGYTDATRARNQTSELILDWRRDYDTVEAAYAEACREENESNRAVSVEDLQAHDDALTDLARRAAEIFDTLSDNAPLTDFTCRLCQRGIYRDKHGAWVNPDATGDDSIWRECCEDNHHSIAAEHEPE